ncbi:MAG: 4-hydroxy-tetrahydrodipicolinate synthase [Burkholderiaceae bacterium]
MMSFTGIWVPLVTPFHNGAIDRAALRSLVRVMAGAGVSGLVACGSTGEAAALSGEEQLEVLDIVLDASAGLPVVMGISGNNMEAVRGTLQHLRGRPIAALLVPAPYYIRPAQAGLIEYFHVLADAAPAPLIVYNIPYRTGVGIELETMRAIARHERVVAVKDCGGDLGLTMNLIADASLQVLAGEDQQMLSTLCLGGSGAIAASAHIRPDLFVRIAQTVREGKLETAREMFYRLLPLIQLLFAEPNPGPLKAALATMGLMRDELRMPMQAASAALREKLGVELKRLERL